MFRKQGSYVKPVEKLCLLWNNSFMFFVFQKHYLIGIVTL